MNGSKLFGSVISEATGYAPWFGPSGGGIYPHLPHSPPPPPAHTHVAGGPPAVWHGASFALLHTAAPGHTRNIFSAKLVPYSGAQGGPALGDHPKDPPAGSDILIHGHTTHSEYALLPLMTSRQRDSL